MLKVDAEFQKLINPLRQEEFRELERSILSEGVRDPLVLWERSKGLPVLVDGHHRWQIIQNHQIREFPTTRHVFINRQEVLEFIVRNQCARRNVSMFSKCLLYLQLTPILQKRAKDNQRQSMGRGKEGGMNSVQPYRVDDELAKLSGVSRQTIQRVRSLEQNADSLTLEQLRNGQISINQAFKTTKKYQIQREVEMRYISNKAPLSEERFMVKKSDALTFLSSIPDETFDAVITDPPYGIGYKYNDAREKYNDPENYGQWIRKVASELNRVLKKGGFLAVFQSGKYFRHLWDWFGDDILIYAHCRNFTQMRSSEPVAFGFDPVVIRYKKGASPLVPAKLKRNLNFFVSQTAGQISTTGTPESLHPCPRPLDAIEELVENFVIERGHILDPFCGSGTTGVACLKHDRYFSGVDNNQKYIRLASNRLAVASGALSQSFNVGP